MTNLATLIILVAMVLLVWFWADSLRARERALRSCARACKEISAQLLDETVALRRLSLARNQNGRAVWRRTYRFEYTLDGGQRLQGSAVLRGRAVESVAIRSLDGSTQFEQNNKLH